MTLSKSYDSYVYVARFIYVYSFNSCNFTFFLSITSKLKISPESCYMNLVFTLPIIAVQNCRYFKEEIVVIFCIVCCLRICCYRLKKSCYLNLVFTLPTIAVAAPSLAAATHWLAPLPPWPIFWECPNTLSPARGKTGVRLG